MAEAPLIAGVDEAGRGPLAGPVMAAAVILHPDHPIPGLADSKTLSARRREQLAASIRHHALAWAVARMDVGDIDRLNILNATLEAMRRAVIALDPPPGSALVDGNRPPELPCPVTCLIGGDALEPAISAASILAKTARDAWMLELHGRFPGYGFDRHKGYPTRQHLAQLEALGPCPEHRHSFAPVRRLQS